MYEHLDLTPTMRALMQQAHKEGEIWENFQTQVAARQKVDTPNVCGSREEAEEVARVLRDELIALLKTGEVNQYYQKRPVYWCEDWLGGYRRYLYPPNVNFDGVSFAGASLWGLRECGSFRNVDLRG